MASSSSSESSSASSPARAIIFDIDGTLADSWKLGFDATLEVLAQHDIPTISHEEYHTHTRYATPDRLARHAGLQPGDSDYETVGQALGREFDDLYIGLVSLETAKFYPGIAQLLQSVPESIQLGALTNAAARYADAVLKVNSQAAASAGSDIDAMALYNRFGSIRGADTVPHPKPSPDGLYTVCQDLTTAAGDSAPVSPSACWYVGDSPSDAGAAHAAGMPSIGVTWGSHSRESLANAPFTHLCDSVEELQLLLQKRAF